MVIIIYFIYVYDLDSCLTVCSFQMMFSHADQQLWRSIKILQLSESRSTKLYIVQYICIKLAVKLALEYKTLHFYPVSGNVVSKIVFNIYIFCIIWLESIILTCVCRILIVHLAASCITSYFIISPYVLCVKSLK